MDDEKICTFRSNLLSALQGIVNLAIRRGRAVGVDIEWVGAFRGDIVFSGDLFILMPILHVSGCCICPYLWGGSGRGYPYAHQKRNKGQEGLHSRSDLVKRLIINRLESVCFCHLQMGQFQSCQLEDLYIIQYRVTCLNSLYTYVVLVIWPLIMSGIGCKWSPNPGRKMQQRYIQPCQGIWSFGYARSTSITGYYLLYLFNYRKLKHRSYPTSFSLRFSQEQEHFPFSIVLSQTYCFICA